MKKALITGISGQLGSHIAQLLLSKDYQVFGLTTNINNTKNIFSILDKIKLIKCDLRDDKLIYNTLNEINPDEIYNMGAQSSVKQSWEQPYLTANINSMAIISLLDYIKNKNIKFIQASSSEMFGNLSAIPIDENTPFRPIHPYGISKLHSHCMVEVMRKAYSLFACSAIIFNTTSTRQDENYIVPKIAKAAARIKLGLQDKLILGNMDSQRDISHASDTAEAMWLMAQQAKPQDYIIASGFTHSIQKIVEACFNHVELNWKDHIEQDQKFVRPADINITIGDPSKAKTQLGWSPKYHFEKIIYEMVDYYLQA